MKKDLLTIYDLSKEDIDRIFSIAKDLKEKQKKGAFEQPLRGRTLGMIFEKPSTRTRVSFEVGMTQLGGHALYLRWGDTQLERGESMADTAKTLSRYIDAVMIRTFSQDKVEELACYADIPVINGLTDLLHPCQILSDVFTIIEHKGGYEDLKVAYTGDGNNVANSWIHAAIRLGFHLTLGCPEGYGPHPDLLLIAEREAKSRIELVHDPIAAVKEADVISTDTWVSMGCEEEHEKRLKVFDRYQMT
jgi:ornithine carbamoyltransferase